jgi:hypothetical protein
LRIADAITVRSCIPPVSWFGGPMGRGGWVGMIAVVKCAKRDSRAPDGATAAKAGE